MNSFPYLIGLGLELKDEIEIINNNYKNIIIMLFKKITT